MLEVVFVSVLALYQESAIIADYRVETQARHTACLERSVKDPEGAYEDGLVWQYEANRPEARHCTAIALFEMGKFSDAAARLEALATSSDGGTIERRAIYFAQAGNAWLLANNPEAAVVALKEAVKLSPDNRDVLIDRARANLLLKNWLEAEEDLTRALDIKTADPEALLMRAKARLEMGLRSDAKIDVQTGLAIDPQNIDLLVMRGHINEAQRLAGE